METKKGRRFLIAILLAAASISASAFPSGKVKRIDPAQLTAMLKGGNIFLVNVHVPYAGEIAGTNAFIPYDQTDQLLAQYPKDKRRTIVVYCRSGRMSAIASEALAAAGYVNVFDLSGGMEAWERAGQ
jgi:phage shock protein E